jgi:rhodanese-related sulfurtransferase
VKSITPQRAKNLAEEGMEFALLDTREPGQFGEGHALLANNTPYSELEFIIAKLVPRASSRVALLDDGDGVSERAARRLTDSGYQHVAVVEGGMPAWKAQGLPIYKGVNVPSKAFGEFVEHARGTPSIDADELAEMMASGKPMVVLDGRTPEEFQRMSIPMAISCPNAELGLRVDALCPDPDTTVVVNCAGRTRSIIGAQSLIDLGVKNRVVALRNGTMGWRLAERELRTGEQASLQLQLSDGQLDAAHTRAKAMALRDGLEFVDSHTVTAWMSDESRTTYLLDVRTEAEYKEAHPWQAVHAPGGQLVQGTDGWIAVRSARVVLVDHLEVRAVSTAHWLKQMGLDVYVLHGRDVRAISTEYPTRPGDIKSKLTMLDGGLTAGAMAGGIPCIDLRSSAAYRAGHIEGAQWGIRPRLGRLNLGPRVVLVADEIRIAELVAVDLLEVGVEVVGVLDGDVNAWQTSGLSVVASDDDPADADRVDFLYFVHDRHHGNLDAAREYLAWETGLVDAMDADERALFSAVDGT